MKLYGIPNCNTVKKARTWLDNNNITYEFCDFKKQVLDESMAQDWLNQQAWEKLINRSGMTWRKLSDEEKAAIVDNNSAAALMLNKTSVIKRPILVKEGKILTLGFNEATYASLLLG